MPRCDCLWCPGVELWRPDVTVQHAPRTGVAGCRGGGSVSKYERRWSCWRPRVDVRSRWLRWRPRTAAHRLGHLTASVCSSAAATATAAAATRGSGSRGRPRERDSGQQLHRVRVPLRAGRRRGGLAHRPLQLERPGAVAAAVGVGGHGGIIAAGVPQGKHRPSGGRPGGLLSRAGLIGCLLPAALAGSPWQRRGRLLCGRATLSALRHGPSCPGGRWPGWLSRRACRLAVCCFGRSPWRGSGWWASIAGAAQGHGAGQETASRPVWPG